MKVNQAQDALIKNLITHWQNQGVIDENQANKMKNSYQVAGFDWQNLAFIAFFFAIVCIILAVSLLLANQWLMHFLESLVATSVLLKIAVFLVLATGLYFWAYKRSLHYPFKIYSNEGFFLLGASFTAISLVYIAFVSKYLHANYAILILLASFIYGFIGLKLKSKINWILALLGIGYWFGVFTFEGLNDDVFYLGMNLPMRFIPFGGIMAIAGYYLPYRYKENNFYGQSTFIGGMVYFFTALWLVTIFGNYGRLGSWYDVGNLQLVHWSIISGLVCIGSIYAGLKLKENVFRDLGFIFLLVNLYTRYFEFFWDRLHISVFFMVLGLSFWIIGKQAEKYWQKNDANAKN